MLNYCMLVGRIKTINDNSITIETIRPSKDDEPIFDLLDIEVSKTMMPNVVKHIKINDLTGVKGYLVNDNGVKIKAEKITFLQHAESEE